MNLDGRNFLVVGGSHGISHTIVQRAIEAGAQLFCVSRSGDAPDKCAGSLTLDVTSDDLSALSDMLPEQLHGVVYAPGTINLKPFNRLTRDDFINDYTINLLGAVSVLQAAYPSLKATRDGSVVLFSTVAVGTGMNFHSSVASAKAAVEGLGRSLAAEWASSNIRVNVIAPSMTDTPLAGRLLSSDKQRENAAGRHPLGRIGSSGDIASAALYLLSPDASWVTGQVLGVDGGLGSLR